MRKIAIVGAGGFGREVKMVLERLNAIKPQYDIIGFYDDNDNLPDVIQGIKRMGGIKDLLEIKEDLDVVLGIGIPHIKNKIIKELSVKDNLHFPNIIDPSAIIGTYNIKLGKGNVICAGVILTCDILLDDFITLNLSCTVGHDTHIKSFASFMPSVNISGEVVIGDEVYVGTGAKIINQLEIGNNTTVGAGAVVAKSLPPFCTAVGIPAKPIKFHNEQ